MEVVTYGWRAQNQLRRSNLPGDDRKNLLKDSFPVSHNAMQTMKKKHGGKHNGGILLKKIQLKL